MGDKVGEGCAYGNLGNAYHSLGDFQKAIEHHELRLKIAKEVGDKAGEGRAYGNLGIAYRSLGDFKTAIEHHERHLKIAKEVGDKAGEGRAYGNLGNAYDSLGDFQKAIEHHERRLKIAKEVGDKVGEGRAYGNLGIAYRSLGDFQTAIEHHERHLKIAKEVGDKAGEGCAYGNLGIAYRSLGDFQTAIEHHERRLKIAKEVGDKAGEGRAYGNLGIAYDSLGDFQTAIEHHERDLKIAKEVGDKAGEGRAYGNLGIAYDSLGDFQTAIEHHERDLKIAKEVGDKAGEGSAYGNLGNAYQSLGDFQKAIEHHELRLKIAKEVGDKAGEGRAYGNLGNAYRCLRHFKTAFEHHERDLNIAKEVGDKAGEGCAYGNLGNVYLSLKFSRRAIEHHERHLKIAKEVGDKAGEGAAYGNLGCDYSSLEDFRRAIEYHERCLKSAKEAGSKVVVASSLFNLGLDSGSQGDPSRAVDYLQTSVITYNEIRAGLHPKDEWKISFRDAHDDAYTHLWRKYSEQGAVLKALLSAEDGRAQALRDLMDLKYMSGEASYQSHFPEKSVYVPLICLSSNIVFIAIAEGEIFFWLIQNGEDVKTRTQKVKSFISQEEVVLFIENIVKGVICENRSLDEPCDEKLANERSPQNSVPSQRSALRELYDVIIAPIADLFNGDELIFVPDGPLYLVPYAALVDPLSKYLCESFRIRVIPSLTTLQLITDCPADFHKRTGALLVGDPCLEEVLYKGRKLVQLPCARKEVEVIGQILGTAPLVGGEATKAEVLKRLSSVALVHIAAHGRMGTGEIFLAPNPTRATPRPEEEDYLLTMRDVSQAEIRARLVALSCCHSATGEVKAEGVVGIARAFLGAGARSVLVSLWALPDEATMHFMEHFYRELFKGKKASEALNRAMECMRESEQFREVKNWAPFVLIGDDVTLELPER